MIERRKIGRERVTETEKTERERERERERKRERRICVWFNAQQGDSS